MSETILSLRNITKSFGDNKVIKGIDMDIDAGEFITILGPSGCGKTTMLRIIAGLENPDSGSVSISGQDVTALPPEKRNVNTVFQNYALFPHMNVYKNIAYGLKLRGLKKDEIDKKVKEALELVQLPGYEKRMPDQLSGGQRQRVAIARAIVNDPALLLLDEPLGALDLKLRRQMQVELKNLQNRLGITFIYITHDQEEALNMSSRIAVMNGGVFEQVGSPDDIYARPTTRFAASFIGDANIIDAKIVSADKECAIASFAGGSIRVCGSSLKAGDSVALSVRAERISYSDKSENGFDLEGVIERHSYIGGVLKTAIKLKNDQELTITGSNPTASYPVGSVVKVYWDPQFAAIVEGGA